MSVQAELLPTTPLPLDVAVPVPADAAGPSARRRRWTPRRTSRLQNLGTTVLALALTLLAWQAAVWLLDMPSYTLPEPLAVADQIVASRAILLESSWPTLQEIALGFGLSVAVGVPLGIAVVEWRLFGRIVDPIIVGSQAVPKIAIAPLFVMWWGFGMTPKIVIAFLIAFFPIVVNTSIGLRAVAGDLVDLGRSMGAGKLTMLLRVKLPAALPSVFAGLRVAMTLAVIGAVVGEFIGADEGLGRLIVVANGRLHTELVFATVVVLTVLGVLAYKVVEVAEHLVIPWHREKQELHDAAGG